MSVFNALIRKRKGKVWTVQLLKIVFFTTAITLLIFSSTVGAVYIGEDTESEPVGWEDKGIPEGLLDHEDWCARFPDLCGGQQGGQQPKGPEPSQPDPKSDSPDWVKDPSGTKPGSVPEPKPEPKPDSGPEQVPEPKPESNPEINTPSDSTSHQPGYDSDNYETDYDPDEEWLEDFIKSKEEEERREAEEREAEEHFRWLHEEAPFEEDYMNFQHDPFISHGDKELPWWVPPTIELIDDATDYAPGKGLINVIRHLNNGEPLQALQELVSMPFGWVGTFISHVQKLTGTELTMENVQYMFTLTHDDNKPFQEWTDEEIRMVDPLYIPLQEDKVDTPYHW